MEPTAPKAFSIPVVDISAETYRHVIVARGTEEVYQGRLDEIDAAPACGANQ